MTKRRSSAAKTTQARSLISTVILAVVVVIALVISSITGIDVLSLIGLTTPVPTAVITSPTPTPLPPGTEVANVPGGALAAINLPRGIGAQKGFWQVLFTAPTVNNRRDTTGGIDTQLAAAINSTQRTLDIAAFEFDDAVLTQAVLDANKRGVKVRMVTDNQYGLKADDSTIPQFVAAGIAVVDDKRSALMHNKFMILDSSVVWTGSWNFTTSGTYTNNNNALTLRSRRAVEIYQAEFNQMFERNLFGPRKARIENTSFTQDGVPIQVLFAPEDPVVPTIIANLQKAGHDIRFMTFSFTVDEISAALLEKAGDGVTVQGIFETSGSERDDSELRPLFCAGLPVRQDGSGALIFHHKVFIVDDNLVLTGSFNISDNATNSNDENLVVVQDKDIAAQYIAEFNRRWAEAKAPNLTCN